MAEGDLFDLIGRLRRHLLLCYLMQLCFAMTIVATLLVVRSIDKAELIHAIQSTKCDCSKQQHQRQPNVHNENHINTSSKFDELFLGLHKEYQNGLRTTSGILSAGTSVPNDSKCGVISGSN